MLSSPGRLGVTSSSCFMASSLRLMRVHLPLVSGRTCFQLGNLPSISLVMKVQRPDSSLIHPGFASLAGFPFLAGSSSCARLHAQRSRLLVHQVRPLQELRIRDDHRLLEVEAEGVGREQTATIGADDVMELLVRHIQAGPVEDLAGGILAATFQGLPQCQTKARLQRNAGLVDGGHWREFIRRQGVDGCVPPCCRQWNTAASPCLCRPG